MLAAVVLLAVTATPAAAGTHVTFAVMPGPLWMDAGHVTDARGTDLGYRLDVAHNTVSAY